MSRLLDHAMNTMIRYKYDTMVKDCDPIIGNEGSPRKKRHSQVNPNCVCNASPHKQSLPQSHLTPSLSLTILVPYPFEIAIRHPTLLFHPPLGASPHLNSVSALPHSPALLLLPNPHTLTFLSPSSPHTPLYPKAIIGT